MDAAAAASATVISNCRGVMASPPPIDRVPRSIAVRGDSSRRFFRQDQKGGLPIREGSGHRAVSAGKPRSRMCCSKASWYDKRTPRLAGCTPRLQGAPRHRGFQFLNDEIPDVLIFFRRMTGIFHVAHDARLAGPASESPAPRQGNEPCSLSPSPSRAGSVPIRSRNRGEGRLVQQGVGRPL